MLFRGVTALLWFQIKHGFSSLVDRFGFDRSCIDLPKLLPSKQKLSLSHLGLLLVRAGKQPRQQRGSARVRLPQEPAVANLVLAFKIFSSWQNKIFPHESGERAGNASTAATRTQPLGRL